MDRNTKPFTDLPSDTLFHIFSECDVLDILALSSTCKQLQRIADEHQVWLHQAKRLQIPIPHGTAPSKAELKGWALSRVRVDVCWTKRRPGDLVLHAFEIDDDFVDAHFVPGGEFIVLLYTNGDVGLNRIGRSEVTGDLDLREVARYKEPGEIDGPSSWSRLLTETSYGCPVLVWAGFLDWEDFPVPPIDPVARAIEKKEHVCSDPDGPGHVIARISAMKDTVFFICNGVPAVAGGMGITLVVGFGADQVMRQFHLNPPRDDDPSYKRFFFVSENGFILTDRLGIHLYHIPEPRAVNDGYRLTPTWSWWSLVMEHAGYRGTLYTTSPHAALWLQGEQTTHTLEFGLDESSSFPVVVGHHIAEGQPAYYHTGDHLKLKGRKVMGIETKEHGKTVFKTGVLGKPDVTRQLHPSSPDSHDGPWPAPGQVKYMDLDEVTGRIMVAIGPVLYCAQQLCLADLPI